MDNIIKKTIKMSMTTGSTTGCTGCHIIIPDLTAKYYIKFCITQENNDIGFFDAIENYVDLGDDDNNPDIDENIPN